MDIKVKKAQVTIFVIVAIVLIALVALLFLFRLGKIPSLIGGFEENPQKYIENCIEPKIRDGVDLLLKQGGDIEPKLYKTFKFSDENKYNNISFLCYTSKNYLPCVAQRPVLINHLENELYNYISEDIEKCFEKWEKSMEQAGYTMNTGKLNYNIELNPGKITINPEKEIKANRKEESLSYEKFRIVIKSKIYDLAVVGQEIVSQEAEYCNFESQGFMLFYPNFDIDKFRTSDLNLIYTIEDKKTKEKFRFAIRGCVIPAGI